MKQDIIVQLLGDTPFAISLTAFIYALIGALVVILIDINRRKPLTEDSPINFSWKFFFNDNWSRILVTLLLIGLSIRFYKEKTGEDITAFVGLGIGLVSDFLGILVKSFRGKVKDTIGKE